MSVVNHLARTVGRFGHYARPSTAVMGRPAVVASTLTTTTVTSSSASQWRLSSSTTQEEQQTQPVADRQPHAISFEDYIKLRKKLSIRGMIFGVPVGIGGLMGTSYYFAATLPNLTTQNPEEIELIMNMDPLVFASLASTVAGLASFFVGTSMFSTLWRMFFRNQAAALDRREEDFRRRIIKHRAGSLDFNHDYYGDKVKSLQDYRNWLRDQAKIRKRLETGVSDDVLKSKSSTPEGQQ